MSEQKNTNVCSITGLEPEIAEALEQLRIRLDLTEAVFFNLIQAQPDARDLASKARSYLLKSLQATTPGLAETEAVFGESALETALRAVRNMKAK